MIVMKKIMSEKMIGMELCEGLCKDVKRGGGVMVETGGEMYESVQRGMQTGVGLREGGEGGEGGGEFGERGRKGVEWETGRGDGDGRGSWR